MAGLRIASTLDTFKFPESQYVGMELIPEGTEQERWQRALGPLPGFWLNLSHFVSKDVISVLIHES